MPVSDKTAIVTGAGSKRGIGRATAHALAAAGWNVAILDLDEPSAKEAADEVAERQRVQTVGIGCDVTDEASVEQRAGRPRRLDPSRRSTGQQRRHHLPDPLPRGHRRRVGPDLRRERPRLLQHHPPGRAGHGRARFRPHRLPVLSLGRAGRRRIRCGGVLGGEGRAARVRPSAGPRAGAERCDGQLRRSRLHRNRHHRRRAHGRA